MNEDFFTTEQALAYALETAVKYSLIQGGREPTEEDIAELPTYLK